MKTSIIINNINGQQFNELRDFIQNLIRESMNALDSHDAEGIMWYEDCTMDDYFTEWTEIWDEDERIGDGIDTIAHKFVLNDDTRADFENAFEQARDAAFEEYMKGLAEEIKNTVDCDWQELDADDIDKSDFVRVGYASEKEYNFGDSTALFYAIYRAFGIDPETDMEGDEESDIDPITFQTDFARWLGAVAYSEQDGTEDFYKKNEPKTIFCDFDFCDLYIQAEGGWDGWYHPVWAKIVKDEDGDYIELSLGDQVSNGTTFRDNDGSTPKSWVGNIEVWRRTWGKDDAEAWAEEFNLNPEDFDSDEELFHEVEGRDLDGCFEEAIEEIKQNIIEYAKSEGYDEVEF